MSLHIPFFVALKNPFRIYLTAIERELEQGIATHQPGFKAFIEAVTDTLATNETKRIK